MQEENLMTDETDDDLEDVSLHYARRKTLPLNALLDVEKEFFRTVAEGDVSAVELFLETYPSLNINCVNYQGLTALHLAVKKEHKDVVELLLDLPNIDLTDTVLHAVATGNIEITELMLNHIRASDPAKGHLLEQKEYPYSIEFDSDMTAIILAAQRGQYQMVRMLIGRGHTIPHKDHPPYCTCKVCKKTRTYRDANLSRIKLNILKAISNPAYLCQETEDPIYTVFNVDREVRESALCDMEFQAEYYSLSDELHQFVVDFISGCRNPAEIEVILKQRVGYTSGREIKFPRLQLAVERHQKEFVGHSLVQQVLSNYWLGDYTMWNRMSVYARGFKMVIRIFELPIIAVAIIFAPNTKYAIKHQAPVNKFISSVASYLTFVLLTYTLSYLDGARRTAGCPYTGLEPIIVVFVIGYFCSTLKQFWLKGPYRFLHVLWDVYDLTMQILFFMTVILWMVAWNKLDSERNSGKHILPRMYWNSLEPTLVHEGVYAVACIMSFGRLAYFCLQSSRIGPLQISMGKMFVQIFFFMMFCFVLMTGFSIPMTRLYIYYAGMSQRNDQGLIRYQQSSFTSFRNSLSTLFWAMFCMSPIESVDVVIQNVGGSKEHPKINYHHFTEAVGRILFGFYEILMVIALVNTLIAVLSNTFQRVVDNSDIEWKFARTKLWMFFFHEAGALPSPYNLFPTANTFLYYYNFLMALTGKKKGTKAKFNVWRFFYYEEDRNPWEDAEEYEKLMIRLVQRYFRNKDKETD